MSQGTSYRAFYGEPYLRKLHQEGYPRTEAERKKFNSDFYDVLGLRSGGKHDINTASTAVSRLNHCIRFNEAPGWVKSDPTLITIFEEVVEDYKIKYGNEPISDTTLETEKDQTELDHTELDHTELDHTELDQTKMDQTNPGSNEEINSSLDERSMDKPNEPKKRQAKRKAEDSEKKVKKSTTLKKIKNEPIVHEESNDVSIPQTPKTVPARRSGSALQQLKEEIARKDAKIAKLEEELKVSQLSEKQLTELDDMFAFTKERIRQILSKGN